jgi:co-chaperonin GroES (HSP10)
MGELSEHGFIPVHYKVLLRQHQMEDTYKNTDGSNSQILIPQAEKDKEQWRVSVMEVIHVGGAAFSDWGPEEVRPKAGDWVITREYAGFKVKNKRGEEYQVCTDEDILALTEAPIGADNE